MKDKISVEELQSEFNAFKEKTKILDEIKALGGIQNIYTKLNELEGKINKIYDENSYKNNFLMVRLKKETSIGYQAIEGLMKIEHIRYNGERFDFKCNYIGTIGSLFSFIGFTESKTLSEYVTHKGKPMSPKVLENAIKHDPPKEWYVIKKILNDLDLSKK